jgi:tetratricopeptide (TPR) repeat protein
MHIETEALAKLMRFVQARSPTSLDELIKSATRHIENSQSSDDRSQSFLQRAELFAEKKEYDLAGRDYDSAIDVRGVSDTVRYQNFLFRGNYLLSRAENALAERDLDAALRIRPQDFDARFLHAWTKIHLKDPAAALSEFSALLSQLPTVLARRREYALHFIFVLSKRQRQEISSAFNAGDHQITARLYEGRGDAHRDLGNLVEAINDYDRALKECPVNPELLARRARASFDQSHWMAAVDDLWARELLIFRHPNRRRKWPCMAGS